MLNRDSEDVWAWFSFARVLIWIGIGVAAYLWGWLGAVAFVSMASLYANVASDFAAWRADRNPKLDRRLDEIERKLDRLLPPGR